MIVSSIYFVFLELVINILYSLNYSLIKDSILWFIFSGIIATTNSIHSKNSKELFKKHIVVNLKVTLIIEFLINFYVFPLIIEILIIPIIIFFEISKYSLTKVEDSSGKDLLLKIIRIIEAVLGYFIIVYIIYNCITNYLNLLNTDVAFSFIHPLLLMVLYFPFTYFWVLYCKYEVLLVSIKTVFRNIHKENIGNYLRKNIIKYSNLSINKVTDIADNKYFFWISIESYDDVDLMITCYKHKIDKRRFS